MKPAKPLLAPVRFSGSTSLPESEGESYCVRQSLSREEVSVGTLLEHMSSATPTAIRRLSCDPASDRCHRYTTHCKQLTFLGLKGRAYASIEATPTAAGLCILFTLPRCTTEDSSRDARRHRRSFCADSTRPCASQKTARKGTLFAVKPCMRRTIGYAAQHSISQLRPMFIDRKEPAQNEVALDVLYCGICHSDVHQVKNEWKNTLYPCMPGHEIVGKVAKVGSAVTKYKVGDLVGVGCMIDSCHECESCREGLEQYCSNERGFLATYNSYQRQPSEQMHTFGGYSDFMVVREDFVLRIPPNLSPAAAAPIVCAGVTTYSALKSGGRLKTSTSRLWASAAWARWPCNWQRRWART